MPPRRSSRTSARPSVEPEAPLPTKRKRGQTADPESQTNEVQAEEPRRTRRSTSSRPSSVQPRARKSSRPQASLPEVPETEDEKVEPLPPTKKARPSVDTQEEREYEEEKPKVSSRAPTARRGKPVSVGRKPSSTTARSRRSTRAVSTLVKGEEDDAGEQDGEESKVDPMQADASSSRRTSLATSSNASSLGRKSDAAHDSEDDARTELRKAKTTNKNKPPSRKPARRVVDSPSNSSDESEVDKKLQITEDAVKDGPDAPETAKESSEQSQEDQDEEETSLFDPPSMPAPSSLPQTMPEESTGPKPRLVIHKMALVNFKSYAGRQEIGPFHKSFSSIVGPNGSGKSNTIDALLFVFGYRASKMRQGKLSELIHNSARYPDLTECSVEVHFREIIDLPGPDSFEVVPGSQLIVTRQAFKNNSSRYTVNSKTSSYTEVQTLLKGRGIDLDHNRFLILQGEVESIAQMKPKAATEHDEGLLEYLEDIIGTSKYKEPIDDALVEMERLQEERGVKLNRLRIVEKEKSALEAQKKEAEDYLRLKNEHIRAQSRLWQWILWKCFVNEADFKRKITKLEQELEDETNRNKDDILHLEQLQAHYEKREAAYAEIKAAAAEALKELAAREKEEVGLQERHKHTASKAKKLKKSLQDDTTARAKALQDIKDSEAKIAKEKANVEKYEKKLAEEEKVLESIRDSLKDKTQGFHDQIEVKQKELQPWTAKINAKQAEIDVASSERDSLVKKAEELEASRKEAEETLENLKSEHTVKVKEHEKLKNNKADLQRLTQAAETKVQECQSTVRECRGKASSSRQKIEEAKASQADNRSQNNVLDSLTRLQATGRISGFHGRLGSLGTIPDKFDVAISTAAPTLHHMVVDKVEQGQACIEYLRAQNVGRASFMVLEKLGHGDSIAKISTPENVPRLFDLIKPKDPRFAPAFFKAVGNTLVAENMDQANRIAYGARRWKVVTLEGQLIETSGTMSGGGSQPARGAMSSKLAAESVSPQVLRSYEQESQNAAKHLDQAEVELKMAEEELDRLVKSGPQIDIAYQKLGLDIENSKRRISEAEKRVHEANSQNKPAKADLSRISVLAKEIAAWEAELASLHTQSAKIEDAIKQLEKKILDIGGSRLLKQKSTVEGLNLHISLANEEITKAEVALAKAQKDSVKLDTSVKTNTAAMEEVDTELSELNKRLNDLTQYVAQLQAKVNDAQEAAENSKDDLDQLKAELDAEDKKIEKFRQKEMEIKQGLADTRKEADENEKLIDHWRIQHDKLQLEEIDDDDDDDEEENANDPNTSKAAEQVEAVRQKAEGEAEVKSEESHLPKEKLKDKASSQELKLYRPDELAKLKQREMVAGIELLDENLKKSKPDLSVLKEYRKREEEFMNRAKDLDSITADRDAQKKKYDGLRKQRLDEFMAGFNLISLKLKEMYQMITLGGNAELELVDSMDPFSEGIIFSVMPPKKSWKNISNLSGGEKTLSSLALVFALHVFKPTPLYFMDEIDAALDFRNVSIVANYIKDRTKNAQFIIISLRNDMFELSHRLIGIYKTANATRSISIDNHALTVPPAKA